ncbi:related to DBP7 - RNA helicase required for 60S ribosomal subunit assembly [Melanopsichium pennsylvanicum]|uniref:ATP-dependent RNA helicase n=2 Tax=Melanopsichium pennsylvanicum TaxID=63383 RepID=A0AAJ4XTU9_9BASI|nr:related to DBP7-RNA helicase required for 60S ribosomal subunit assembly [Melanopsichium pennsylvanicum 4]SNX87996.1 related to DBP7 - RNA helicase required for 60S ribosomal subunit assembly [Melanopsichium pennsylvanicum]
MDDDDGLMLNFAPAAASPAGRPKQSAKARFVHKRTQQQLRRNAPKQIAPPADTAAAKATSSLTSTPQVQAAAPSTSSDIGRNNRSTAAKRQRIDPTITSTTSSSSTRLTTPRFEPRSATSKTVPAPAPATDTDTATATRKAALSTASSSSTGPSNSGFKSSAGIVSTLFPAHGVLEHPSTAFTPFQRNAYDPTNAPSTTSDFASCGLDPLLVYHLASKMKIGSNPTSIQKAALPHLLHPRLDRDILIQAQTGSGKTLTYLLPIVQSLLPLCQESFIDRSVGTLAIILAPTRELARQIYEVLDKLVSLALSLKEQNQEQDQTTVRRTRWLVPGLLSGGSTKNHEKQRLRKGCPILVSTPGRLLDHLQNTSSFDVGKCRWLVLDEADRLLEMGFEDQLNGIVRALDGRRNLACTAARHAMPGFEETVELGDAHWIPDHDVMDTLGMTWWAHPRRVILCSATLDENVQVLAGKTLINPKIIRGVKQDDADTNQDGAPSSSDGDGETAMVKRRDQKFAAPAQLVQSYVTTPPKLRLVTLLSLLRAYISRARRHSSDPTILSSGSGRVIVFMSCTDSVDFHYAAFGGARMNSIENDPNPPVSTQDETLPPHTVSELIPGVPIFRLHGSMSQQDRMNSLRGFSGIATKKQAAHIQDEGGFQGSILLCTSVASRGLDLPDVGCVIQLDPPTEGGIEEYLHRVGRTARVGRSGESWLMVLPEEVGWVDHVLESHMTIQGKCLDVVSQKRGTVKKISAASIEIVLQQGMGGTTGTLEYQSRATEVQLAFERWVISGERPSLLARKAFLSHVRAYATHSAEEKEYFNVRCLHLGHLAKAFALREAPRALGAKSASIGSTSNMNADAGVGSTGHEIQSKAKPKKRAQPDSSSSSSSSSSDSYSDSDDAGSDYETEILRKNKTNKNQSGVFKGDGFELDKAALAKLTETIIAQADGDGSNRSKKLARKAARAAAAGGVAGERAKQTDAEARMYAKVRAMGKMSKKGGVLGAHGADEFQIA